MFSSCTIGKVNLSANFHFRLVADDAHVGPTFACLIAVQFQRLKEGDRFWFENKNSYPNPFSDSQIAQLRTVSSGQLHINFNVRME